MTSWSDIQRLAADLQRVQLSQASKKLSEANCVEVVGKLIGRSLIDVVFTRDGHSYVTRKHLQTEVKNECVAAGGRAPLTDIAASLNVDFDHVDRTAKAISAEDDAFVLSNGELFANEYVHRLQCELRQLLEDSGSQTFAGLCKHWDLSQDLLKSLLLDHLSADFEGVVDGETIYTRSFLTARKLLLRAVLIAITKVTSIVVIQQRVGLSPKRFWAAFDELAQEGEVPGRIGGARTSPSCVYTPFVHEMLMSACVQKTIRQDEYILMSTLKKLGVDGVNGVKQILGKDAPPLVSLPTILLTQSLHGLCISTAAEEAKAKNLCDVRVVLQMLNIPLELSDVDQLGEDVVAKDSKLLYADGYLFTAELLRNIVAALEPQISRRSVEEGERVEREKKSGGPKPTKKAEETDDDWADGKGKGKKKGGKAPSKAQASKARGDDVPTVPKNISAERYAMNLKELEKWLGAVKDVDVPEEIRATVVEKIEPEVQAQLRKKVEEFAARQIAASAQTQKKSIAALAERAQQLYASLCIFENTAICMNEPLGTDLLAYLLRTTGTDVANAVLAYATGEENVALLKEKQREETIEALPAAVRDPIKTVFASLKHDDCARLHAAVAGCTSISLALHRPDKNMKSNFVLTMAEDLQEQATKASEPATSLLLVILFLYTKSAKPINASGKFVSQLIPPLVGLVDEETFTLLNSCQKGVVTCLKNKEDHVARDLLNAEIKTLKKVVFADEVREQLLQLKPQHQQQEVAE